MCLRTKFQFTPLREGRRQSAVNCFKFRHFNSRPSARGDDDGQGKSTFYCGISIHAPPRGATMKKLVSWQQNLAFQFTPLREGRPTVSATAHASTRISIHAPPRGATFDKATVVSRYSHFNSRPSARGDRTYLRKLVQKVFQFTPLREGRRFREMGGCMEFSISIHAPPRGATLADKITVRVCVFQFTPLREGRPKSA